MPRNRVIRPEFWNDEKLGLESESLQLTFVGTWTFSDDYGVVRANPVWLKNQIFPYKHALRLEVFSKWLEALEGHEMLIPFTVRGEKYYFIRTFRQHQSVEKPSKTRNCSEEELRKALEMLGYEEQADNSWLKVAEQSGNSRVIVDDEEKRSISISESNGIANAIPAREPKRVQKFDQENSLKLEFEKLKIPEDAKEAWPVIKAWIDEKKPQFAEAYAVAWNIFASFYGFSAVTVVNEPRKKKFRTRIKSPDFDFFTILHKAKHSEFLKKSTWFNFDWIIENDSNYLKILEGQYR